MNLQYSENKLFSVFSKLPLLSAKQFKKYHDRSDTKHDVFLFPKNYYTKIIAPATSQSTTRALKDGFGKYTLHLCGGDLSRELFFHLPKNYKFFPPEIYCFDVKNLPPKEFRKQRISHSKLKITYVTNFDVAKLTDLNVLPRKFCRNIRLLTFCRSHGNFFPKTLLSLLINIKKIEPEYILITLSQNYGNRDPLNREAKSIAKILTYRNIVMKMKHIDEKALKLNIFTLPLPKDSPIRKILPINYPSTRIDPISLIRYYSDCYSIKSVDAYCLDPNIKKQFSLDNPYYPNEISLFFERHDIKK